MQNLIKRIDKSVLHDAILIWGKYAQMEMIKEEAIELAIDELADMIIVLSQVEFLFDTELIAERIDFKMKRLKGKAL